MEVPVYSLAGEVVRNIELSDDVFAVPFNEAVVHQALVRQRANARQGTSSTKTRGEVAGSTRKLYRQKHTGMARAGSKKSPTRRGGGITFGPKPRDYRQDMPKKMRQLAIRCVLSAKAREAELKVMEEPKFDQPKTKEMAAVLVALGINSSVLIVTDMPEENLVKSARNLAGVKTMPAHILSVADVLSYKMLLMTESGVRRAERLWGGGHASV
ncbi:MAG: 50S ribosomal protein L4 [Dehalococcoidales bacterium]|nr:50S ribosomal protein L4 [Dehalococcoidales bacterium]